MQTQSSRRLFPITITNQSGTTNAHPDPQHISVGLGDEVVWQGAADWTVDFDGPNGSPFALSHFCGSAGNPDHSGLPVNAKLNTDYKYTAKISGAAPKDPIIHTDP